MLFLGNCDARIALMYLNAKTKEDNTSSFLKEKLKTIWEFPVHQTKKGLLHFLAPYTFNQSSLHTFKLAIEL